MSAQLLLGLVVLLVTASGEAQATPPVDSPAAAVQQVGPEKIGVPSHKAPRSRVERDAIPRIDEFCLDAEYLGLAYSVPQLALVKAIYGLPLSAEERDVYGECTERLAYREGRRVAQVTVMAGRRSGKDSRIAAPILIYEGLYGEFEASLGEPIVLPIIANNERNARIAYKYLRAYIAKRPRLNRWVRLENEANLLATNARTEAEIEFRCFACKAAALRGWSIPAAVMDEVAFFAVEGGIGKDEEIQDAIEGAGINFAGQIIVKISTPSTKRGLLYDDMQNYWGVDDADVLVWKAPSLTMNPTINAERIAAARRRRPETARVEYDAEFRNDVETFIPRAFVEAIVVKTRRELGPVAGERYIAAVDPTGGTGTDAFTLAIVHAEARNGRPLIVQDVMRGWRAKRGEKLDLTATVAEIATILARYQVWTVTGDAYAGDWPTQEFRKVGVTYEKSAYDKAGAFLEFQSWVARAELDLLDDEQLVTETALLERKVTPKEKKPTIGHPKGGHDDYPNALAQAVAKIQASIHAPATVSGAQLDREAAAARETTPNSPAELERTWRQRPGGSGGFWGGAERGRVRFSR